MNLLLLCVGARKAYYNDFNRSLGDFSIQAMPHAYREAFLNVCHEFGFAILFESVGPHRSHRWIVLDPTKVKEPIPTTPKGLGELLGFPCSANALKDGVCTKNTVSLDIYIETEYERTYVTSFVCFKTRKSAYMKWFKTFKQSTKDLHGFFRVVRPILVETQLDCTNGKPRVLSEEEFT